MYTNEGMGKKSIGAIRSICLIGRMGSFCRNWEVTQNSKKLHRKCKKSLKKVDFFARLNIIRLTEPNTPLNDADHVGSFNFKENIVWEN